MHNTACRLWSFLQEIESQEQNLHSNAQIIFFDLELHLVTVMTPVYWNRISGSVLKSALVGENIGSSIRGFGNGRASDGFTNLVGCISSFTTVGAGVGGGIGAGVGTAVGPGGAVAGAGLGAAIGGFFGFGFGLGYCGHEAINKGSDGGDKGGSAPVSEGEGGATDTGNQGGPEIAGDATEKPGGTESNDGQDGQDGTTSDDSVETTVGYPAPDDMFNMRSGFIEQVSTESDGEGDTTDRSPVGPRPNRAAHGVVTYALHGLAALAAHSRSRHLPSSALRP